MLKQNKERNRSNKKCKNKQSPKKQNSIKLKNWVKNF